MTMTATKLALLGGSRIGKIECPLFPRFTQRAIERVTDLLKRGQTMGLGRSHSPEVAETEEALSAWHGGRHVLGSSSGHGALHMALAGLEIGPGDEVITTPYTWGASTSCILHQGAIPVFADVDAETGLLDPEAVENAITERTRAILVVHIFGQPADAPRLREIANRHGIALIEDGSQAHGAEIAGRRVGEFGDAACFSCMGGKVLASIEAGYLVTPDEGVYWRGAMIGQHMGRSTDKGFPEELRPFVDSLVYTYRINPITAVLLTEQLQKLPEELEARRSNAEHLRNALRDAQFIKIPDYAKGVRPSFHMLSMNVDTEAAGVTRDTFAAALTAEGLAAFAYVPSPIPDWPRIQWQNYRGPVTAWGENLKSAATDYRHLDLPNCRHKISCSLESRFDFIDPAPEIMDRIAEIILKVEANIDDLRTHEREKGPAPKTRR